MSASWNQLAIANDDNTVAMMQIVGRAWSRAELIVEDDAVQVLTDIAMPSANQVAGATFTPESADRRIDELVDRAKQHGVPMIWTVGPRSAPTDLSQRLLAHGFQFSNSRPIMAAEIMGLRPLPLGVRLRIQEVVDPGALPLWVKASQASFAFPSEMLSELTERYVSIGLGPASPIRHFVGLVDGEPVGCATLSLAGGVAGLYTIGTAPAYRRVGIGAAMTLAACDAAARSGYRYAILQSSRVGEPLYGVLGFQWVGEEITYVWYPYDHA